MSSSATDIVLMVAFGGEFAGLMIALWLILRPLNKHIADLKKLEMQLREFANEKQRRENGKKDE